MLRGIGLEVAVRVSVGSLADHEMIAEVDGPKASLVGHPREGQRVAQRSMAQSDHLAVQRDVNTHSTSPASFAQRLTPWCCAQ